jgi:CubicO group peptidase (beta-lactamase class C family)
MVTKSPEITTVDDPRTIGLDPEALARLRSAVAGDIDKGLHHGAVILVARGGNVGLHEPIGSTDIDANRPARVDDRFWLASLSKSLTAAAALKLIDRGALSLDTRVADAIPEFAVRGKQRVTVYHLLTHTAGTWSGFLPPPPLQWGPVMANTAALAAAVSAQPLTGKPGDYVVYNPFADFTILGEVMHRVDGRPFRDILREEIIEPLGMSETSFGLEVDHPQRVPIRMSDLAPGAAEIDVMHSFNHIIDENAELPYGGGYATTRDVFRFAEMLRLGGEHDGTRVLSPAIVEYGLRNHTGTKTNQFWDFSKEARDIADFPANFMLFGGYVRGEGHYLNCMGNTASPTSFAAVGSGSTMYMVDPERELTFVFLSSGLMEGLGHFERLRRLGDLAVACAER